jgi:uncharacterized protein (TIGR03790 family)
MSNTGSPIFKFNDGFAFRILSLVFACALYFASHGRVEAQTLALNQRVLIVYNSADANSTAVANHYAAQRAIPSANLCAIAPPSTSLVSWAAYTSTVRTPVQNCLTALGSSNILYIVFTYNTPYDLIGPDQATYALDQFVADIWDVYEPPGQYGLPTSAQPYYAANQAEGNVYTPFVSLAAFRSQNAALIYSVWRLDAATPALAQGLVDKAIAAETAGLTGQVCIDETTNPPSYDYGLGGPEWDLRMAANFAREAGFSVTEDQNSAEFGTAPAPLTCPNVALYSGWYSFNNYNNAFTWSTGAIGYHLDSASAVNPRGGSNWSANALLNGITATHGAVSEPYVTGFAHPDGVFRNLFQGANLGDAFLRNTSFLKWMMLNIGDPLYRPFPAGFPAVTAPGNSLALNPQYLIGGGPSTGIITLAAAAGSDTIFTLASNLTSVATVPASVTVPAGQTTASFPISTSFVASDSPLFITATAPGLTLSNTLVPVAVLSGLLVNPTSVTGGATATGTVYLNVIAPAGGIVVGLATNNAAASVPPTVTVPAGASVVAFPITTSVVTAAVTVSIGASYGGALSTASLTVTVGAPMISGVAAVNLTTSGATINWSTDQASDSQVAYGPTVSYGSLSALNSTQVTSHSVNLTGLAPSTTYHYQVMSRNAQGVLGTSADFVFTTAGGLIGYWNFDEGSGTIANDTSGSGYNGTVNGAVWTAGKINGALSFNGSTSYVVTPNIALGSTFSASAWVNPAVMPQGGYVRIMETQYNGGLYLGTNSSGTKYKFIVNSATGTTAGCGFGYGCAEGGTIAAGWHLVTGTYDGATATLSVDGAMVASDTFTAPPRTNFPLYIGRYYGGNGNGWNGSVDDVRLYSRALAAAEVSTLYNSASSPDTTPPTTPGNVSATAVSGSQINVSWSASTDNVGVAGYKVLRNGSLAGSTTTALTYSDTGLAASTTYSYTVEAFDAAGNISTPSTAVNATTLTPDTTPPSVSITAPAANATVSGLVSVSATATDNVAVASVQFQLDGANLGALLTSAPYAISWNTATATNTGHTLTAIATDTSGNSATSAPVAVTVSNTSTGPPTAGLIGYWNFDEGSGTVAHDTSGSGYNGTVNGAVWTTGEINGALAFNGGAAYVVTPNIALGSSFSVSAWVNPAVMPQGGYGRILETQYNGGLYLGTNSSGTKYKFIVNTGAGSTGSCGLGFGCAEGGAIAAGWHLVTATYNGSTATLYLDGTVVASDTFTAPSATNFPLYVGRYYGGGYGWNGSVDDVRLYNRALTATEVTAIYTSAGSSDTTPPTTPGNVSATPISSSQINVSWSASTDNVGVAGYKVFRNGNLAGSTTTALTYPDTGLAASTAYSYTVEAFDAAGNVSTPSIAVNATTLIPDTTPPSVSITAPAANATVSGTISVSANATDNVAVASVQFQLDGVNLGALLTSAPYTISWNTATATNTGHTLTAIAIDTSGNSATSAPVAVTVSNTSTGPPTAGLIGYWNFDEGSGTVAHDTSGSGYNGTVNGTVWTTGEINGALAFNGGTAYVVTPNIALGSTFSVSAWVNPAVTKQLAYGRILETQYNGGLYLGVSSAGTKYKFIVNTGIGSTGGCGIVYGCAEGGTVASGWHLVTATYNGSTATLYVDGAVVASDTFTAPSATNFPLYIGRYYGGGTGWNGSVDDVRLYNRALAAAEVSAIFSFAGSSDTTPPTTPGNVSATPISSSQINVSWSASTDNVGVAGYKVFRNGNLAGSTTTALTYPDTGLAASTAYSYTVEAFDAAGNVSTPSTAVNATTLTPDTTPPSVSITAPAMNAAVSGTVSVSANATDNVAVASVQFQLDGTNLGALLTSTPYTISWNTATAANTNHALTAIATDTSGNSATSAPVTVTVSNTSTAPPTQGLIGYWNFDEGSGTVANDTSGSGYNGAVNGAVWTTGLINGALAFNGGTAYVVTPNIALGSAFSVSAWVNPAVTKQLGYARILETKYNGGLYLGVNSAGTKYKFIVNTGIGSTGGCGIVYGCAEGGTITAGWHLVTATYDGTTATLYVDGSVVANDTFTAPGATNFPLYVGRYYAGGYGWNGSVDEVRLYNRALSPAEVANIESFQ